MSSQTTAQTDSTTAVAPSEDAVPQAVGDVGTKGCKDECGVQIPVNGPDYTDECYATMQRSAGRVPCACGKDCGTWTDPAKGRMSGSCYKAVRQSQADNLEREKAHAVHERAFCVDRIRVVREQFPVLDYAPIDHIIAEGDSLFVSRRFHDAATNYTVALNRANSLAATHLAKVEIPSQKLEFESLLATLPLPSDDLVKEMAKWADPEVIDKQVLNNRQVDAKTAYFQLKKGVDEIRRIIGELKERVKLYREIAQPVIAPAPKLTKRERTAQGEHRRSKSNGWQPRRDEAGDD